MLCSRSGRGDRASKFGGQNPALESMMRRRERHALRQARRQALVARPARGQQHELFWSVELLERARKQDGVARDARRVADQAGVQDDDGLHRRPGTVRRVR